MKKDVYWFAHDANARRDQKITMMRLVYGAEGYGWYWMLVEMMREAEEHKLKLTGKYTMASLAKELDAEPKKLKEYIDDCIKEFELFQSDGEYFWSPALTKRMKKYHETIEKRKEAANKRWKKEESSNAKGMQMHSKSNAFAYQEHSTCNAFAMLGDKIRGEEIRLEEKREEERIGECEREGKPTDEQLRQHVLSVYGDMLQNLDAEERETVISGQVEILKKQNLMQ